MFCQNCGCEAEDGSVFCGNCGSTLLDDEVQQDAANTVPIQTTQASSGLDTTSTLPQTPVASQAPGETKKSSKTPLVIIIVVLALAAVIAAVAFTFGSGESEQPSSVEVGKHQIVFETFGGSQYESKSYDSGTVIEMKDYPVRLGSTFEGWYLDADLTKPVTFPYTLSGNDPEAITFYAKWKENVMPSTTTTTTTSSLDPASDPTSVLPYSSSTYLVEDDLYGLSYDQLQRAINEIYARNGYIFQQSASEKQYFESRPWYQGDEVNQDVVKSRFNQYESANVKLMQSYRDGRF